MKRVVDHLTARAGTTFGPYGWPLIDAEGTPLTSVEGVVVRAQVREHNRRGAALLHAWTSEGATPNITLAVLQIDGAPRAVALLNATPAETAAWTWRCCPYDVLVEAFGRVDQGIGGDFTVYRGPTQ